MSKVQFRVRPVSRYVVTRYAKEGPVAGSSVIGEFPSQAGARVVAHAMAGAEGGVCENILPAHDVPAMLRNIAEQAEDVQRGFVVLMHQDGTTSAYGLGAKVGDPVELLDAGIAELVRVGAVQAPRKQYAVVGRSFEPETKVFYADSEVVAEQWRRDAEHLHGQEFRIFSRAAE
jgi:hypothetical protein